MADFFVEFRKEQFDPGGSSGHGAVDFVSDTIHCALIDANTWNPDTTNTAQQDKADITGGAIIADAALASKTWTIVAGVGKFDAADLTFTSVSGAESEDLVLYKNTGTASDSLLICNFTSADVTGLPITPNGTDIIVTWNASGIFTW